MESLHDHTEHHPPGLGDRTLKSSFCGPSFGNAPEMALQADDLSRKSGCTRQRPLRTVSSMTSRGTVRSWDFDSECGVIDSADTPSGCRATFWDLMVEGISVTDEDGCSSIGLPVGEAVDFEWGTDEGDDEFLHHAIAVWPSRCDPPAKIPRGAYRGSLWTMMNGDDRDGGIQIARQMNPVDLTPSLPGEVHVVE